MCFRRSGATLSSRGASGTSTSGQCGTSGLVAGTPEISALLGNAVGGSQQQHGRTNVRGQSRLGSFHSTLSNAYTRVGCFAHANTRVLTYMARDFYARERYCGLSAYARRERVLGAIG